MTVRILIRPYQSRDEAAVVELLRELQRHEARFCDRMLPALRQQRPADTLERLAWEAGRKWLRISVLAATEAAHRVYEEFGFADQFHYMEKPLS
jgi:hypothetical protein